ncbi:hypothetical protein CSAL01_07364 [Colletotrichum salicis]|uniref:Uncharacterized protein n=1 Tax=Colletotrichum salicis TaxID=1209931 RepID=A0A135TH80_9PEZI|nr:hypothetical protein CSAL01_07364 [Colletotrichum salicis]
MGNGENMSSNRYITLPRDLVCQAHRWNCILLPRAIAAWNDHGRDRIAAETSACPSDGNAERGCNPFDRAVVFESVLEPETERSSWKSSTSTKLATR